VEPAVSSTLKVYRLVIPASNDRSYDLLAMRRDRPMLLLLLLLPLAFATGCHGYRADVETICEVQGLVPWRPGDTNAARHTAEIADYLQAHVHSARGRSLLDRLNHAASDRERAALLSSAASEVGLTSCQMADSYAAFARSRSTHTP
jgi:hypothetical protein